MQKPGNRTFHLFVGVALLLTVGVGCKKDPPPEPDTFALPSGRGAFIINEGNFMWSNATLDYLDLERDTLYEQVYQTVHTDGLGDVFQSMTLQGDTAWLVINNSGKVLAVDAVTLDKYAEMEGLTSPRYALPYGGKVFITDIYAGEVHVADISTQTLTASLPMGGWTEELIQVNGEIWVAVKGADYLAVIDPIAVSVVDSIAVNAGPTFVEADQQGRIWVMCSGDGNTPPALQAIDPDTKTVVKDFDFSPAIAPSNLSINSAGDLLYYTYDGGVYRMSITDNTLPAQPLFALSTQALYGMEVDPYDGDIWIMDALSFAQPGKLIRYNSQGDSITSYTVGLIPNGMEFR